MFYIITIPHQSPCRLHEFESDEEFVSYVSERESSINIFSSIDDAWGSFTEDLYGAIEVRTLADLEFARQYDSHKRFEVMELLEKINPEYLTV